MKTTFQKNLKMQKKIGKLINQKFANKRFKFKNNPFTKEFIFQKIESYLLDTHSVLIQNLRHASIQRDLTEEQQCILISLKQDQMLYKLFSGILAIDACVKQIIKQNTGIIISFIKATNLLFINFKLLFKQFQDYKKAIKTTQSLNTSIKIQNQQTGMIKFFDSLKFLGIIIKSSWGESQQIHLKDEDESVIYEQMKQQIQKLQGLMQVNYQNLSHKLVELQNSQQQVIISELQKENNFLKWRLSEKDNTITQYEQSIYNLDLSQVRNEQKYGFNVQSQIMLKQCQTQKVNFKQIDSNFTFNQETNSKIYQKISNLNQQIYLLKSKNQFLISENQRLKQQIQSSSVNIQANKYDSLLQQINQMKKSLLKFKTQSQIHQKKAIQNASIIQTMNQDFMTQMKKYNTVFFKLNSDIKVLQKQINGKNRVIDQLSIINSKLQTEVNQNKQIIQDIQNKILKINPNKNHFKINNQIQMELKQQQNHKCKKIKEKQLIKDKQLIKEKQLSPLKKIDVHISGGKMSISQKYIYNQKEDQKDKNQFTQKNLNQYLKFQYENSKQLKILRQKSKQKKQEKSSSPSPSKLHSTSNFKNIKK